jgi:hypothetical protein
VWLELEWEKYDGGGVSGGPTGVAGAAPRVLNPSDRRL